MSRENYEKGMNMPWLEIIETCGCLMMLIMFLCACCVRCCFNRRNENGQVLAPPQPNVVVLQDNIPTSQTFPADTIWQDRRQVGQRLVQYNLLGKYTITFYCFICNVSMPSTLIFLDVLNYLL